MTIQAPHTVHTSKKAYAAKKKHLFAYHFVLGFCRRAALSVYPFVSKCQNTRLGQSKKKKKTKTENKKHGSKSIYGNIRLNQAKQKTL